MLELNNFNKLERLLLLGVGCDPISRAAAEGSGVVGLCCTFLLAMGGFLRLNDMGVRVPSFESLRMTFVLWDLLVIGFDCQSPRHHVPTEGLSTLVEKSIVGCWELLAYVTFWVPPLRFATVGMTVNETDPATAGSVCFITSTKPALLSYFD
ncbi:MAG: hypothetical protein HOJ22_05835 [Chloroflexi bacterium]|nr:hypothetical protein [Chloroflexota bacterium]MBT5627795.1 hypothetical protein [Chloroflexota bacterium]